MSGRRRADAAPECPTNGARRGVVLVVTLLALVAIEAIALGVIFLATQETLVAAAHERALRARLAAEAAAVDALARWRASPVHPACSAAEPHTALDTLRTTTTDGFTAAALVEPLAGRWLLARAVATDEAGTRFRTGVAFAAADAAAWLALFPAAIAGAASGEGVPPAPVPPAPGAAADAVPVLVALAERGASGELHLGATVEDGRCAHGAAGNWGAPLERENPCFGYVPVIHADGAARVVSGAGQGVLVVTGRLVLAAGSHFEGVVLVAGELVVERGAVLGGAVTVADGGTADIDGSVSFSVCTVLRALQASRAAGTSGPVPGPVWLPLF